MPKLTTKYGEDTSNKESSDGKYNEETESDEHDQPIVEDVIEGDDKESSPEP